MAATPSAAIAAKQVYRAKLRPTLLRSRSKRLFVWHGACKGYRSARQEPRSLPPGRVPGKKRLFLPGQQPILNEFAPLSQSHATSATKSVQIRPQADEYGSLSNASCAAKKPFTSVLTRLSPIPLFSIRVTICQPASPLFGTQRFPACCW